MSDILALHRMGMRLRGEIVLEEKRTDLKKVRLELAEAALSRAVKVTVSPKNSADLANQQRSDDVANDPD